MDSTRLASGAAKASAAPTGRPRGRARRDEILAVAYRLFASSGYRGTGIARIAAEAGLTVAGLLHHFGSKEGVLMAVLERRDEEDLERARALVEPGGLEFVRRLPAFVEHVLATPGISQLTLVLLAENVEPEAPGHAYLVRRYRMLRSSMAAALQVGQERGEIRPDVDVAMVALEVSAFVDGVIGQWLLDPERIDLRAAFEHLSARLVRDLTA